MQITLTEDEARILKKVLTSYLSDLRMEIADTDSMNFRDSLKAEKAFLKKVIDQIGGA